MLTAIVDSSGYLSRGLLLGGAVAAYIASRWAAGLLAGRNGAAPGLRALGHLLPVAAVALLATLTGQASIALNVLLATSVGGLTLVAGLVLCMGQHSEPCPPESAKRTWLLVLPVGLLLLLIGFSGQFTWFHAAVLLVQAAVAAFIWRSAAASTPSGREPVKRGRFLVLSMVLLTGLACLAGWALLVATERLAKENSHLPMEILTIALLGPILTLPLIGAGGALVHRGRSWEAISTSIGLLILCICVVLPLVILAKPLSQHVPANLLLTSDNTTLLPPATEPTTQSVADEPPAGLVYPLGIWRVDVMAVVLAGLYLLPVACGRWTVGRFDGIVLILGYLAYLLFAVISRARW